MSQDPTERRRYPRFELACPVELRDSTGQVLAQTETANVSHGGFLASLPSQAGITLEDVLSIDLLVPPDAAGAGQPRPYACQGKVVRVQDLDDPEAKVVAVEFLQPLDLGLNDT